MDVLGRAGYRLPTEAEWEYACRAGTITSRYYGSSVELLKKYARFQSNSAGHASRCGSLLPNDLGLFDTLGNVFEWCQERASGVPRGNRGTSTDRWLMHEKIGMTQLRVQRGGSYGNMADASRAAYRTSEMPSYQGVYSGMRLVKTLD